MDINDSLITEGTSLLEVLNSLPYQILILNKRKEVVFGNNAFAAAFGIEDIEVAFGLKPGDALQCENIHKGLCGCGSAEDCQFCGLNSTFQKILVSQTDEKGSGQLAYRKNGEMQILQFDVVASVLNTDDETYYLFSLFDTSKEMENESFQRLFFHDILNISGSLQGLFNLLIKKPEYLQNPDLIKMAYNLCLQLSDEILKQKEILYAEKGELIVDLSRCNSLHFMKEVKDSLVQNKVAEGKNITIDLNSPVFSFMTDKTLLFRVMNNMLKNALEAEKKGANVILGCSKTSETVVFYVNNPAYISSSIRPYIFRKTFSTKGKGRGLGTYSIKLIGEQLLNGKVWFTSSENEGTKFYIQLKR